MRFVIKDGSLEPVLALVVFQGNGVLMNLTNCTAMFTMYDQAGTAKVSAQNMVITDAAAGKLEYRWQAVDVNTPGVYRGLVRLVLASSKPLILPVEGYIEVKVEDA